MIFCFLVGIDFAQILHFIDVFAGKSSVSYTIHTCLYTFGDIATRAFAFSNSETVLRPAPSICNWIFLRMASVDFIFYCFEIGWFSFCAFCDNQMIFRLNPFHSILSAFHPAFAHIALFGWLQAHSNSPPSILERYGSAPYRPSIYCLSYAAVFFTLSLSSLRISYRE